MFRNIESQIKILKTELSTLKKIIIMKISTVFEYDSYKNREMYNIIFLHYGLCAEFIKSILLVFLNFIKHNERNIYFSNPQNRVSFKKWYEEKNSLFAEHRRKTPIYIRLCVANTIWIFSVVLCNFLQIKIFIPFVVLHCRASVN